MRLRSTGKVDERDHGPPLLDVKRAFGALMRDVTSRRGLLVVAAIGLGAVGIVLGLGPRDGAALATGAAVVVLGVALLAASRRISSQQRRANQLERSDLAAEKRITRIESRLKGLETQPRSVTQIVGPLPEDSAAIESVIRRITAARSVLTERRITASEPVVVRESDATPLVTVVVPTYNEQRFVGETIESVKRQSYTNFECIVVDDASTDDSVLVAWRAIAGDPRFRVVRHMSNGGLSASRNTGIRLALGTYVTFLDADDLLMEDSLLCRLEAMADWADDASVAATFCGIRLAPEDVTLDQLPPREEWAPPPFHDFVSSDGECPFNAHAPLLKTEIVRAAGGFSERMRHGGEDWDLWLRIMRGGWIFRPAPHVAAVYRQKGSSMARRMALEHVAVSSGLIASAFMKADALPATTHGAMPEPLQVYKQQLTVSRRTIQYAAMALLEGDRDVAEEALRGLPPGTWEFLARHLDVGGIATDGFRRSLGISPKEAASLIYDLAPFRAEIVALVREHTRGHIPAPEPAAPPSFEIVFVPEAAHQAQQMADLVPGLTGAVAMINPEREHGAQGVAQVLELEDLPLFSVNEWTLWNASTQVLVVPRPHGATVEALARAVEAGGGRVIELADELDDLLALDERAFPSGGRTVVTSDGLAAALDTSLPVAQPDVWVAGGDPESAWTVEEYPTTRFDSEAIERFRDVHKGEQVVIIGNGPSLNSLDLTRLAAANTIAVNGIFYASMGFDPTYYVVEDTAVMDDNLEAIMAYPAGHKFFPSIYRPKIGDQPNVSYFMMNRGFYAPESPAYCLPRFSTDASQRIYCGQSVTIINLQLAYHMGFTEVVLIGMDFSYVIPEDADRTGDVLTSRSDDPNHFHPDYFGKGKKWKDPKLDRVLANYAMAKRMFEADGRRIVNATAGGKLELFDRVPYDDLFG